MEKFLIFTSLASLMLDLEWYSRNPHPMGSAAQEDISKVLVKRGHDLGFRSFVQMFPAQTPPVPAATHSTAALTTKPPLVSVVGRNVSWVKPGKEDCSVLFVSHYDTKDGTSQNLRLVGANDGGSSTVLLLALGRVLKDAPPEDFTPGSWGRCQVIFLWTDGEESTLWDWNEGQRRYGVQDNLYGSRAFVGTYLKEKDSKTGRWILESQPLVLTVVLDMVGHKNQVLDITKGSQAGAAKQLQKLGTENKLIINTDRLNVEDDHKPFLDRGVPVLHVIDWSNLKEWHTEKDTVDIIDAQKIRAFGDVLVRFLQQQKEVEVHGGPREN
jgi:hypothetical protein